MNIIHSKNIALTYLKNMDQELWDVRFCPETPRNYYKEIGKKHTIFMCAVENGKCVGVLDGQELGYDENNKKIYEVNIATNYPGVGKTLIKEFRNKYPNSILVGIIKMSNPLSTKYALQYLDIVVSNNLYDMFRGTNNVIFNMTSLMLKYPGMDKQELRLLKMASHKDYITIEMEYVAKALGFMFDNDDIRQEIFDVVTKVQVNQYQDFMRYAKKYHPTKINK